MNPATIIRIAIPVVIQGIQFVHGRRHKIAEMADPFLAKHERKNRAARGTRAALRYWASL